MRSRQRLAARAAIVVLAALAAGAAEAREKELVIEFPSSDRCILMGEEIEAGALGVRLGKAQDASPAFDTMNFRIVIGSGVPKGERDKVASEAVGVLQSLGAGNRVTVEHRAHPIVRVLTSLWFWLLVVVGVAAVVVSKKRKEAQDSWKQAT